MVEAVVEGVLGEAADGEESHCPGEPRSEEPTSRGGREVSCSDAEECCPGEVRGAEDRVVSGGCDDVLCEDWVRR